MNIIVCAVFSEAKALIEFFDLKQVKKKPFEVFTGEDIELIISGIGNISSAIATTYILQDKNINKIINIGICGTADQTKNIGSFYNIKSIIYAPTNKKYQIDRIGEKLYSYDKPIFDKNKVNKKGLVDMESYGFYSAALKFVAKDKIKVYKIVSDHLDISELSSGVVYGLIKDNVDRIIL